MAGTENVKTKEFTDERMNKLKNVNNKINLLVHIMGWLNGKPMKLQDVKPMGRRQRPTPKSDWVAFKLSTYLEEVAGKF